MQSNAGRIVYILTVLRLWLPDNEIFSFRPNFGFSHPRVWRKLTRFPHGRITTDLEEVVLTFVTLTLLADLDHDNVINTYTLHVSFFHEFKNNADTSVPCSSFSPVGMILHSECIFTVSLELWC